MKMVHLYLVPNWFLGYDILLQLLFGIITLVVSIFAFHIFRLSGQRQPKLFSTSFFFISLAYFFKAFFNFLGLTELNRNICAAFKIMSINMLNVIGVYVYIVFFTIGLMTLAYMTFRVKNAKLYSLLLILPLLSFLLIENPLSVYHILSSILLIYIFIHYLIAYLGNKRFNVLLMLLAFGLLLIGNIHFIFSVITNQIFSVLANETYYVIAHGFELVAYVFILVNLILVKKHEQKAG